MFSPTDLPLPCAAPLLAASMMPGPPPVMTARLFLASPGHRHGGLVIGIGLLHPRRAEDGDRGADLGEDFKGIHEFGHDAEDAPRVFFDEAS